MATDTNMGERGEPLVRCETCRGYTTASAAHVCGTWRLPPDLGDLDSTRLTDSQLRGTACVRCGGSLAGPYVYGRPASNALGPDGRPACAYSPTGQAHYLAIHLHPCT